MGFFQIALDGPAGAGKSTIAKTLAKELNFTFINSGAIFRCICIAVIDSGITITDNKEIANLLPSLSIGQKGDTIYLNNVDVSERSRANEISSIVPIIAKIPEVRTFAVDAQRKIAETDNIVVEGRDTTTVVFPNATMKC
jgi:cytidylate kinase